MQKEVIEKMATFVTAGFALAAALAWNAAIEEIFDMIFAEHSGLWAMIAYAAAVTIVAVAVTLWIAKVAEKTTGRNQDEKKP